jgi:hypothetical protein
VSKLKDYVLSLSKDSIALDAFKADPNAAMEAAGLTTDEQKVLLSGDPQQLGVALRSEEGEGSPDSVTIAIYVYTHVKHVIAVDLASVGEPGGPGE